MQRLKVIFCCVTLLEFSESGSQGCVVRKSEQFYCKLSTMRDKSEENQEEGTPRPNKGTDRQVIHTFLKFFFIKHLQQRNIMHICNKLFFMDVRAKIHS